MMLTCVGSLFQPTRSRRARPGSAPIARAILFVSTHALAKSATIGAGKMVIDELSFNPRAREERDDALLLYASGSDSFQPTRSRRARPVDRTECKFCIAFQPTRSRRARLMPLAITHRAAVFQPTRSRRARLVQRLPRGAVVGVSTHALAKSATHRHVPDHTHFGFQPTRSRRARLEGVGSALMEVWFQPTRSRRARRRQFST